MAWFSNVNLGNLGDLGDIAGSLNKLGESVSTFDIEDFLTNKEGQEGASKDPTGQSGTETAPAAGASAAGASAGPGAAAAVSSLWGAGSSLLQATTEGAAAAGVSGGLWDTGLLQGSAKKEPAAGQPPKAADAVESFIPIPIPSLFGASPFSSDAAAPAQSGPAQTQRQASAVDPPAGQEAIHREDMGKGRIHTEQPAEGIDVKEEGVVQGEEQGEGEGGGDGWGVEMDVAVEEEELMSLPAPRQNDAQADSAREEPSQEAQESQRHAEEAAADTPVAQAQGKAEAEAEAEAGEVAERGENHVGEGTETTEGPQGDWAGAMEGIEVERVDATGETLELGAAADPGAVPTEAEEGDSGAGGEQGVVGTSEEAEASSLQAAVEIVQEEAGHEAAPVPGFESEAAELAEVAEVAPSSEVGAEQGVVAAQGAEAGATEVDAAAELEVQEDRQQLGQGPTPDPEQEEPSPEPAPEPVAHMAPESTVQPPGENGPVTQEQPEPQKEAAQEQEPEPQEQEIQEPQEQEKEQQVPELQQVPVVAEPPQPEAGGAPLEHTEGDVRADEGQSRAEEPEEWSRGLGSSQQESSSDVPGTPVGGREAHEIGEAEGGEVPHSTPVAGAALAAAAEAAGVGAGEGRPREVEQVSSAAHAALEAALRVSSPRAHQGPRGANHVAFDSTPDPLLREQMLSMELALQNAAKQAQARADELAALMQQNDDLKRELAVAQAKKANDAELEALREEYQHRLGAAERKVYALTKERDMLRRDQQRRSDTSGLLKEKDEIIKQVMAEGEELSKKQAAQEASMKKLRVQLREVEEEKQRLASRLQVEEARAESIRRDKGATEKALADAVERGAAELAAQKDFYHAALAQAKEALQQAEARADVEARADGERRMREAGERERMLLMSVEELRQALTRAEQQAAFREQLLRKDLEDMEMRCQAAEARHEELVARMPDSTRPLLRQIEAMQESSNMRVEALAGVERTLNARLSEAEAKAAGSEERERASNERLTQTLSRLAVMEAQLSCLRTEQAQLSRTLEKERHRAAENRAEYLAAQEASAAADMRVKQLEAEVKEVKAKARKDLQEERNRREALEQELEAERAALAEQERKTKAEGRGVGERALAAAQAMQSLQQATAGDHIPTSASLRRIGSNSSNGSFGGEASFLAASLTESLAGAGGGFQGLGVGGPGSTGSGGGGGGGGGERVGSLRFPGSLVPAAALDQLEALLRQKDGELGTCMARIATLESTRDSLAEELVKSTSQNESLLSEVSALPGMKAELDALRRRHASALELMGERDEQVEELRADLQDVKEMYREQIDLLVDQIERLGKSRNGEDT